MSISAPQLVHRYVALISVAGLGLLATLVLGSGVHLLEARSAEFWILTVFLVFGELRPITVPRGDEEGAITTSSTFAFALLLAFGLHAAVLALAVGSVIGDVVGRRAWWKTLFNASQYTLTLCASGAVLSLFTDLGTGPPPHFTSTTLPGVLAAAVTFFVVNVAITMVAVALAQNLPILAFARQEFVFQASTAAVLLTVSPVIVVVADHSLALLPLIGMPVAIAYKSAAIALQREHQALHDALTGLPNRNLFYDRIQQAILASRRGGKSVGLMIIDLDRFKEINDTLGHHMGDQLLKAVGPRLQGALRDSDTVARLGGDEFGVVLRDVSSADEMPQFADRVLDALKRPFHVEGVRLDVEASIGIALYPEHGNTAAVLVQRADVAMYVAKASNEGHTTYAAAHDQNSPSRLALVGELREALDEGHIVLHYQPQISLATGAVHGVEALVRWIHPERGVIGPDQFIPLAEQTGLIKPLTLQVLERALRQCRAWQDDGYAISVAVNLSARTVQDGLLPDDVRDLLVSCGVDPTWLVLEITESSVMADRTRATDVLTRLHGMGVGLSIDDFGTGYSSLSYLKRLPVCELKIDKSFIMNMDLDESDTMIARSTIDLARNLGLRVVAEGIQNTDVWARLRELGCELGQGYLFSRPLAAEDMTRWMESCDRRGGVGEPTNFERALRS